MKQPVRTKRNAKGGAPCGPKLVKQLSVRLTVLEYERIVSLAKSEGRTASNYLRRIVLKGKAS